MGTQFLNPRESIHTQEIKKPKHNKNIKKRTKHHLKYIYNNILSSEKPK